MTPDTTERLRSLLVDVYGSAQPSEPSRHRVMTAINHAADHALPRPTPRRPRVALPAWRRAVATMAAGATLLLPAGAVADSDSLPGDLGYGVRHAVEQLWVGVTWGQADVHARQTVAGRRLAEAAAVSALSGPSDLVQALQAEARDLLGRIEDDAGAQGSDGAQAAEVAAERGADEQRRRRPAHAGTPPAQAAPAGATGRGTSPDLPAPANTDDAPRASSRQTGRPEHAPSDPASGRQVDPGEGSSGAPAARASSGGSARSPAAASSGSPRPPSGQHGPPAQVHGRPATDTPPANGSADDASLPSQGAAPERPAPPPTAPAPAPAPAPPLPPPAAASPGAPPARHAPPAAPAAPAALNQGGQAGPPGPPAAGGPPGGPPAGPPG